MSDFKFTNLFGSVYSKGNILFTNGGKSIVSPIGNRVTIYDLNKNQNFAVETLNRNDITTMAISPDERMLATTDAEGHCVLTNLNTRTPIHFMSFKERVKVMKYSYCGKYIAVSVGDRLKIFISPIKVPQFRPFQLLKIFGPLTDKINCLDWSHDSSLIIVGCRDSTLTIFKFSSQIPGGNIIIKNHKSSLVSVFFVLDSYDIISIDKFGFFSRLVFSSSKNFWSKSIPISFGIERGRLISCDYEKNSGMMILGFDNGVFSLRDSVTHDKIQQISHCSDKITTVAISSSLNLVALGVPAIEQLVVWEYNTESFILKQKGNHFDLVCLNFSGDGMLVVSGSVDGSVKVWDVNSGFSLVTFNEHKSKVSSVRFSNSGQFILSSSFDGTCKTFDMNRYRNFRTFVSPQPVQFSHVTIDCSDELVCGCAQDDFTIYVWSLMTGSLLETLSGHTSVVSHITFIQNSSKLISCSWDQSVRIWDILETTKQLTISNFNSDCIHLAIHPFRNITAILTIRAHIIFWDHETDSILATIEGVSDLGLSRGVNDTLCAENSLKFKYFSSACFSPDGEILIACGKSKYICIYDSQTFILRNRIQTTNNQSLDNVLARLNSSKMTEAGSRYSLENVYSEDEDVYREKSLIKIPGSLKTDISLRKTKPEIILEDVSFCPTGRSFICASTEGLLLFSKDEKLFFNPINLTTDISSEKVLDLIKEKSVSKALLASITIGETELIAKCLENVCFNDISFIAQSLPLYACLKIIMVIAEKCDKKTNHFEFYLKWCNSILMSHGLNLKNQSFFDTNKMLPVIRKLQKDLHNYQQGIGKICESNIHMISYLISQQSLEVSKE